MRSCVVQITVAMALASASCRRDDEVQATIAEVESLADAMVDAVHTADDPKDGVTRARQALSQRRDRLIEQVLTLKRMRTNAMSPQMQRRWRDAFIDALAQLEALRIELREAIAADPELGGQVDALVSEFSDALRRRPTD